MKIQKFADALLLQIDFFFSDNINISWEASSSFFITEQVLFKIIDQHVQSDHNLGLCG